MPTDIKVNDLVYCAMAKPKALLRVVSVNIGGEALVRRNVTNELQKFFYYTVHTNNLIKVVG